MKPLKIGLGGYQPPSSVHNRAAEIFGHELGARLGGGLDYEMDGNMVETKGIKAIDLLSLVESGELEMCYFASSYLADRVAELGIFDLPFVVQSRAQAYAALDGELGALIRDKFLIQTGFRVLAFWDNGFRHFTNGVRSIRTPADCNGLSMRSMNSELHQEFFRALGMKPIFVDVRDLVAAAKSGEVDAQENPLTNTYKFGTYKYHRHITLTGHFFGMSMLLMNNEKFEQCPDYVRAAIEDAASVATKAQRQFAAAEDDEVLSKLDPAENDIVKLTDDERAAFKAAVGDLLENQRAQLGDDLFSYFE